MVSTNYVQVCEEEGDEPVEVPLESDKTLLLPTLTAQFPKCTGLKFKASESGCYRGLRMVDERIFPPGDSGWEGHLYICVFPKDNKRKSDEDTEVTKQKLKCFDGRKCTDLIALNLSWQTDDQKLKDYFSQYGDLVMAQVKRDSNTGKSRGYGFIRFSEYSGQVMCLAERHVIDGRLCDVRVPLSKLEGDRQEVNRKVHVGRLPESIGADALRKHFSQYGKVIDVFIPKPFRSFGFVSFEDADVAASLMGKEQEIQGSTVLIGSAVPKLPPQKRNSTGDESKLQSPMQSPYQPNSGRFWPSPRGLPPAYGMPANVTPVNSPLIPNGMNRSPSTPMGLNPAAAAAAASLTAQYTRAHQRQNGMFVPRSDMKGAADVDNNTALAALNILNNPNVVAAIVSAATAGSMSNPSYSSNGPR